MNALRWTLSYWERKWVSSVLVHRQQNGVYFLSHLPLRRKGLARPVRRPASSTVV